MKNTLLTLVFLTAAITNAVSFRECTFEKYTFDKTHRVDTFIKVGGMNSKGEIYKTDIREGKSQTIGKIEGNDIFAVSFDKQRQSSSSEKIGEVVRDRLFAGNSFDKTHRVNTPTDSGYVFGVNHKLTREGGYYYYNEIIFNKKYRSHTQEKRGRTDCGDDNLFQAAIKLFFNDFN